MAKSKNSSQHNQWRKAHRNPLVVFFDPTGYQPKPLTISQHQEAQDFEIPVPEGLRSQVPPKPPTCSSRHRQGSEGGEGGQAGHRLESAGC
ncbi:60S ribosomal protein L29 [Purpureocillium takamizusanense]|uniref:60S ribosomal protein L29 n=1 Tax=Purpureocillium takamizusanense TaxID=2060973 RepID=A0A9Q8QHF3_9HYPO|nr:60S ribosomal protein L29 [Purpureocillium takamizusanense]UNI19705.1 60S ribosomal protein L29 [Purpureocillium takamizusanense]